MVMICRRLMHRLPAPDRRWRHCSLLDTSWGTVPFQDAKMVPAGEARDIAGVAEEAGDVGRADAVQVEQAVAGRAAVWTAEHLAGFLTSVIDDSLFALWWLIGLGGLRRGEAITVVYADETVTIKDYGSARQITLFERGEPMLQILTSDTHSCAGALIWFMRARWRIENLFKYL